MNALIVEKNDKLLRKKQVAERLACSLRTIDREASCGRLTRVKIRSGVRFRESEIQKIIDEGGL